MIKYWIIRHQFHRGLYWSYNQGEGLPKWVYSVAFAKSFNNQQKEALVTVPGSGIWICIN